MANKETGYAMKRDENNEAIQNSGKSISYQATAGANKVIKASAGFLERIIIGTWVASGVLEVSDSATDGDGNVKILITGAGTNIDGFPKVIEVGAEFASGITADIANFTDITFIYR